MATGTVTVTVSPAPTSGTVTVTVAAAAPTPVGQASGKVTVTVTAPAAATSSSGVWRLVNGAYRPLNVYERRGGVWMPVAGTGLTAKEDAGYQTPHIATPYTPTLFLELAHLPAGMDMGFMSSAGWDPATNEWFIAQQVGADTLIHRYHADGSYFSTMTLTNGGHANQIAVERSGSSLKIWQMWEAKSGTTVVSRSVRRIQYNAVTKTIDQAEEIQLGIGPTTYAAPALDQENDLVCIRYTTGGHDIFKVFRFSELTAGVVNQIGVTVDMGATADTTYQGHAIAGTSIYRITNIPHGADQHQGNSEADWDNGTDVANNIDEYNWLTGALVTTKDYRHAAQFASDADKFRLEPEGLDVILINRKPVLIGNWKTGQGDIGTINEQRTRLMAITPRA